MKIVVLAVALSLIIVGCSNDNERSDLSEAQLDQLTDQVLAIHAARSSPTPSDVVALLAWLDQFKKSGVTPAPKDAGVDQEPKAPPLPPATQLSTQVATAPTTSGQTQPAPATAAVGSREQANARGTCWQDFADAAYSLRSWLCVEDDYLDVVVREVLRRPAADFVVVASGSRTWLIELVGACSVRSGAVVRLYNPNDWTGSGVILSGYNCSYRSMSAFPQ